VFPEEEEKIKVKTKLGWKHIKDSKECLFITT